MPKIWKDAVKKIRKASPGVNPYAVATATAVKAEERQKGTRIATKKGIRRGNMSQAQCTKPNHDQAPTRDRAERGREAP